MLIEDKVAEIFVMTEEFCKIFNANGAVTFVSGSIQTDLGILLWSAAIHCYSSEFFSSYSLSSFS